MYLFHMYTHLFLSILIYSFYATYEIHNGSYDINNIISRESIIVAKFIIRHNVSFADWRVKLATRVKLTCKIAPKEQKLL